MRPLRWISLAFAVSLGGCSLYPIPDDVSFFRTEEIVRSGRCEVQRAILEHLVRRDIIADPRDIPGVSLKITAARARTKIKGVELSKHEEHLLRLIRVAIVYSFDFNVTEINKAGAAAGFRFPGLTNALDVGATGAVDLTRQGSRVFGTEDNWGNLITDQRLCEGVDSPLPSTGLYPLTGSIGVGRVVETFLDIDDQRGAKDNFVDTMTFTTSISGGATAAFVMNPVPNEFRPIAASASAGASRLDMHKLTVSLAFPQAPRGGISNVTRFDGDLNAPDDGPFARPPIWRARYNLCVQDARTRELSLKMLRLTDPLVYCIAYADAFAPSDKKVVVRTVVSNSVSLPPKQSSSTLPGVTPQTVAPEAVAPESAPKAARKAATPRATIRYQTIIKPSREDYRPTIQY